MISTDSMKLNNKKIWLDYTMDRRFELGVYCMDELITLWMLRDRKSVV